MDKQEFRKKLLNFIFGTITFFIIVIFLVFLSVKLWPLQFMESVETSVNRMNSLALKVYQMGSPESAIEIFKDTVREMQKIKVKTAGSPQLNDYLDFQIGIAHARLFKLYTLIGNNQLAEQEYYMATKLIGSRYGLGNKEDLMKFIETLDKKIKL
jgi:hypothetical protein